MDVRISKFTYSIGCYWAAGYPVDTLVRAQVAYNERNPSHTHTAGQIALAIRTIYAKLDGEMLLCGMNPRATNQYK